MDREDKTLSDLAADKFLEDIELAKVMHVGSNGLVGKDLGTRDKLLDLAIQELRPRNNILRYIRQSRLVFQAQSRRILAYKPHSH